MALFLLAIAASAALASAGCSTDLDCSLNGICNKSSGRCACDKPWAGDACATLQFKPVTFPQGYGMAPRPTTTWGGGIIEDKAGGKHHMYVSRMTNNCSLRHWTSNSRIDHAVSTTGVEGPYAFADVAVNTWAHNAAPIALHDGTFAIVHIGTGTGGPNGGANCTSTSTNNQEEPFSFSSSSSSSSSSATPGKSKTLSAKRLEDDAALAASPSAAAGSTIHVSKSLDGPWEPVPTSLGSCNNPAPWVLSNGTILVGCGGLLKSATDVRGPFTTVASFGGHGGGPAGNYEDPQIFTDKRGHFHCFYHVYTTNLPPYSCVNSTVSAHSFSEDGRTWTMSASSPYGTQVELTTGETVTVATRERPKPFFNAQGVMTHLINGVAGVGNCTDSTRTGCVDCKYNHWDYTLVQPLDVDGDDVEEEQKEEEEEEEQEAKQRPNDHSNNEDNAAASCSTDLDCSLNGLCDKSTGACACDKPWGGPRCGVLQYKRQQAVSTKNLYPHNDSDAPAKGPCVTPGHTCDALNTWNGPIAGPVGGKYHMFNPLYKKGSLLATQAMMHGVADDIEGPYRWEAWPDMGSNPAFVTFNDPDAGNKTAYALFAGGKVLVSDDVAGPFKEAGPWPGGNPAPIFHGGKWYATTQSTQSIVTAARLGDSWEHYADVAPRKDKGTQEDPFLWVDARGNWHVINHAYDTSDYQHCGNSTLSAHVFSADDGKTWHMLEPNVEPYTHTVSYADGTEHTYTTLERPNAHFNAQGQMTHLNLAADLQTQDGGCPAYDTCPAKRRGGNCACTNCKYADHAGTIIIALDV